MSEKNEKTPAFYFIVGALIAMVVTLCVMGFIQDRNVRVAYLQGKTSMWDAEEMCVQLHERSLDAEGYCDISPENAQGEYYHYFDCSWGKQKLYASYKSLTLKDKYGMWIVDCKHIKTERVRK